MYPTVKDMLKVFWDQLTVFDRVIFLDKLLAYLFTKVTVWLASILQIFEILNGIFSKVLKEITSALSLEEHTVNFTINGIP